MFDPCSQILTTQILCQYRYALLFRPKKGPCTWWQTVEPNRKLTHAIWALSPFPELWKFPSYFPSCKIIFRITIVFISPYVVESFHQYKLHFSPTSFLAPSSCSSIKFLKSASCMEHAGKIYLSSFCITIFCSLLRVESTAGLTTAIASSFSCPGNFYWFLFSARILLGFILLSVIWTYMMTVVPVLGRFIPSLGCGLLSSGRRE